MAEPPPLLLPHPPPAEDHSDSVSLPGGACRPLTLAAYPSASFHPVLSGNKANPHSGPSDVRGALRCGQPVPGRPSSVRELHGQRGSAHLDLHTPVRGDLLRRHSPHREAAAQAPPDGAGPRLPGTARPPVRRPVHPGARRDRSSPPSASQTAPLPLPAGHPPSPWGPGRPWAPVPICLPTAAAASASPPVPAGGGLGSLPVREIRLASLTKPDELVSAFNSGEVSLIDVDLTGTSELGSSGSYQGLGLPLHRPALSGLQRLPGGCAGTRRSAGPSPVPLTGTPWPRLSSPGTRRRRPSRSTPLSLYNEELAKRLSYDPSILTGLELKGRPLTLLVNIKAPPKARPPMRSPGSSRRPGSGSRWSASPGRNTPPP